MIVSLFPKSLLCNTFWEPFLPAVVMSLTRVQTNFASDKGLRAEPLKIASFVSPSPPQKSSLRNTFRGPRFLANIASLRVKRATSLCFSIASLRHRRSITKKHILHCKIFHNSQELFHIDLQYFIPPLAVFHFYLHPLENSATNGKIDRFWLFFETVFSIKNNRLELSCFFSYNN